MDERHAWVGRALRRSGGARVAAAVRAESEVRITMTHAVAEHDLAQFEAIMRRLAARRTVIAPQQLFARFTADGGGPRSGHELLVTFDDGLLSSYVAAKEVLAPLGIRAMFFVPTAVLELRSDEEMRRFSAERIHYGHRRPDALRPEEYRFMRPEHLRELHATGHMILPHTHSHPKCSEITTRAVVESELREPKRILERLLDAPADGFAFPVGTEHAVGAYSLGYVREIYSLCFTALGGCNTAATDPFLLRRDSIHPWYSLRHVDNLIDGLYDPWYAAKARRLRRRTAASGRGSRTRRLPGASPGREQFLARLTAAFDGLDIGYVLLNESVDAAQADTDVDVALRRDSVDLAHALVEGGALGRVVQCLRYADPWCRYYVLETDEPDRRYRQLDLVCDPWGIGRDGPAPQEAVARLSATDGRRADPAAETLYLAVKRARKRMAGPRHQESLFASFGLDPHGATELLERHFGRDGLAVAAALAEERDLTDVLEALRRRLRRLRRTPRALGRRARFAATRVGRRLVRPTGLVVLVVGPDGAGKSELARRLEQEAAGTFRRVARIHFRPELVPPPGLLLGHSDHATQPHARTPSGAAGSLARLGYLYVDTLLAWLPKVTVPRIRSTLVVIERGMLDLAVDPVRYRLSLPESVLRAASRLFPKADLVLHLDAAPEILRGRKQELEPDELARQLRLWRNLAARPRPDPFVTLDAAAPPRRVLDAALAAIDDRLAERQAGSSSSLLAVQCLGTVDGGGVPYRIVHGRGRPRWLLPAGRGAPGPLGAGLYRPPGVRHAAAAVAMEGAQRLGLTIGPRMTLDASRGLGPAVASALGCRRVELAAAVTGDVRRGERVLLSVRDGHRVLAFAKVAREESACLEHEFAVLRRLADLRLERLKVPEPLACFAWQDCVVLLLRPFRVRARADRVLTSAELDGLAELAHLSGPLSAVLGRGPGLIAVHGDFAPWNSDPCDRRGLLLWDWEESRIGLPLEDLFHWRLQRLARLGRGSVSDLVGSALYPDATVRALAAELEVAPENAAPAALRACLERALERLPSAEVPRRALDALAAAGR